jgi:glycosyltransferase involved in cell wall biosynthesis/predicted SAM-dependent methyltransferase
VKPYPFKDKEFDLCISVATLEHLPEEKLDDAISEMVRVSDRGLYGITFEKTVSDIDDSHVTLHPKGWWEERFRKIAPDYKVEIVDKEDLERGVVDVSKYAPSDGLVKLNIGSFIDMFHYGWENIDEIDLTQFALQNGYLFKRLNVKDGLPYSDGSVDIILASHLLEHFTREEGLLFLKECFRVMKNGGVLRVSVPDTKELAKKYNDGTLMKLTDYAVETAKDSAEAFYKILLDGHKTVYDCDSLVRVLKECGFIDVKQVEAFESSSEVIRKQTIATHPEVSLYVEATAKKNAFTSYGGKVPINGVTGVKSLNEVGGSIRGMGGSTKGKLKIALVSTPMLKVFPDNYGGLESVLGDLAESLAVRGHDVTVFAPNGSKVEGCRVVEVGEALNRVQVNWLEAERTMYEKIKDKLLDFDIVHGMNWFGFEYAARARNPSLRVCHTHHGGLNIKWWKSTTPPFKLNLIAISQWMQRVYASVGFSSRFVYNGVNVEKYPFKKEKGDRLLFVGRFDIFKQPHVAVEVAKKLNMGIDLVGGTFVQDEKYLNDVRASADGKVIRMFENVSHEEKIKFYQNAKCVLFPSKMGEPFGLIVPEANLCGTPVVALNDGAIPETIGKGGIVCSDVDAMVDAVKNSVSSITPKMCRKNGLRFTREIMAENYEKLYYDILAGKEW